MGIQGLIWNFELPHLCVEYVIRRTLPNFMLLHASSMVC